MALIAQNVSFSRHGHTLLQDASLHCNPGEFVALCGPNGAGKTSLLKALAGDVQPQKGKVSIAGHLLATMTLAERARYRAVMPQHNDVAFVFTVAEIIGMGLLFATQQTERDTIIAQVLGMFTLHELAEHCYDRLSGGEKQRVHLARVMAQLLQKQCYEQRYLLLDECSSAMDMAVVHQVFRLLREQCGDQLGIVAIVHDLNLASLYADKIVLMKNQTTVHSGTPEQLMKTGIIDSVFNVHVHVIEHPVHGKPVLIPA